MPYIEKCDIIKLQPDVQQLNCIWSLYIYGI